VSYFTHFIIAYALSFIGSLPFGMINMAVAHTAIRRGLPPAVWMGLGASLVELVQVFVALKFTWLFDENPTVEQVFQVVAAIVFFAGGVYFFFYAKPRAAAPEEAKVNGLKRGAFLKGIFISSVNLMVIPYWIFYGTLLSANDLLVKDNPHVGIFSVGTMFGTFSLMVCYALLGTKILSKSEVVTRWVNKFIGVVLLGFGAYQFWELVN
jgi:threonine/homoserine/homoserine lactone efflux protein